MSLNVQVYQINFNFVLALSSFVLLPNLLTVLIKVYLGDLKSFVVRQQNLLLLVRICFMCTTFVTTFVKFQSVRSFSIYKPHGLPTMDEIDKKIFFFMYLR